MDRRGSMSALQENLTGRGSIVSTQLGLHFSTKVDNESELLGRPRLSVCYLRLAIP
jgi:hypothetical protein